MRIGIMQGRLVPPVDGRIQWFPGAAWREDVSRCAAAGFDGIEWIHSVEPDPANPIARRRGWAEIDDACRASGTRVLAGCYDALLAPRILDDAPESASWRRHLAAIGVMASNLSALGASHLVVPLLGRNRVETDADRTSALAFVRAALEASERSGVEIHLETSLQSAHLRDFLHEVDHARCRATFDTGNVVQFGFDPSTELAGTIDLVGSVHLKDATREGTVPFGAGRVDFDEIARALGAADYRGDCIIQGARGASGADVDGARRYLAIARRAFEACTRDARA